MPARRSIETTREAATQTGRRPAPRRLGWWAVALVATCLAGVATRALWMSGASVSATIVSGDFELKTVALSWQSPTQHASGNGAASLGAISLGGGDVLVLRQTVCSLFSGDNLRVRVGLSWPDAPAASSVTWHIADAAGHRLMPLDGDAGLSQTLDASDDFVGLAQTTWQIVTTLTLPVGLVTYVDPSRPAEMSTLSLGAPSVVANQVRG